MKLVTTVSAVLLAAGAVATCVRLGETDVRGHEDDVVVYRVGLPA